MTLRSILLLASFASLMPAGLVAADISWNSTIGASNYESGGSVTPMGAGFVFELGSFDNSFVPTAENTADWAEHWVALDRAGYNPTTKFFSSKASLATNDLPFHWSQRAYIWGFNQQEPGEWILATNPAWSWPYAGGIQPPLTWSIAASETVAVVGDLNGSAFQMMTAPVPQPPPDVNADAWKHQHFTAIERIDPGVAGWDADPDGDGASNLFELAAGSDPKDPASAPAATIGRVDQGDGEFVLELVLARSHRAAIGYGAEYSTDLQSWDGYGVTVQSDTLAEIVMRFPIAVSHQFVRFEFSL